MAINKKLIHFKKKEDFDNEVANKNILDHSIVFIQDSKEISTHGTIYKTVNWSVLKPSLISFSVDGTEYQAEKGMTWANFINSEYNDGSFWLDNLGRVQYLSRSVSIVETNAIVSSTHNIVANYDYITIQGGGASGGS